MQNRKIKQQKAQYLSPNKIEEDVKSNQIGWERSEITMWKCYHVNAAE